MQAPGWPTRGARALGRLGLASIGLAGCAPVVTTVPPPIVSVDPVALARSAALPEHQQLRLDEARSAQESGEYDRALALFRSILAENPGIGTAYVGVGQVFLLKKDYASAEPAFARGARLEPRNFDAQYGHGLALQMLERFVEAVKAYHRALTLQPESFEANLSLATTYLQMGETRTAVTFAERAIAIRPDHGPAHANLGAIYEKLGRETDALPQYDAALELMEPTAPLLMNLINVLARQKRYVEALNAAERLVRDFPSANAWERLGWCAFRTGDYARSIKAYRTALEYDPDHWPSLNGVGCNALNTWLLGGRRDPESAREAREAFRRSLRVNSDQPRVLELLLKYEL